MKNIGKILGAQLCDLQKSEKFIGVILLGAALSSYFGSLYFRFANEAYLAVNPLESYILNGSTKANFTCTVLFPLMLLSFDAPYFSDRSIYEISRVGRKQWLTAKNWFLILEVLSYNLFCLGISLLFSLFSARDISWVHWGGAILRLARSGGGVFLNFPYSDFLSAYSPMTGALITLVFNSAYCLVLALIMLLANILLGGTKGWPIAIAIHILGYVIGNNGNGLVFKFGFSLLDWAMPASRGADLLLPGLMFAGILAALLMTAGQAEKRLVP